MSIPLFRKPAPTLSDRWFSVDHQVVHLDLDCQAQKHWGFSELTVSPTRKELSSILLNCANLIINHVEVQGKQAAFQQTDPYAIPRAATARAIAGAQGLEQDGPAHGSLVISIPKNVRVVAMESGQMELDSSRPTRQSSLNQESQVKSEITKDSGSIAEQTKEEVSFQPLSVKIHFTSRANPHALQFVGCSEDDNRFPQAYVRGAEVYSLFPCLDNLASKHTWDLTISYPRSSRGRSDTKTSTQDLIAESYVFKGKTEWDALRESLAGKGVSLDLNNSVRENQIVCVGELEEESYNIRTDRKTARFLLDDDSLSAARHIGFIVGTLDSIPLSRNGKQEGRGLAAGDIRPVTAYTSPCKVEMALNTCIPIVPALDYMIEMYHPFPYLAYHICFVDDMADDVQSFAGLTLFSSRLLFPEVVIDHIDPVTRMLVYGVISQWIGIDMVNVHPADLWIVTGLAFFLTDRFLKSLCGENLYQYRQKLAREYVCQHDGGKPSLRDMGARLRYDPHLRHFFEIKSCMVMFMLHQNIIKHAGSTGVEKVAGNLLFQAAKQRGQNKLMTMEMFTRACEKKSHHKYGPFLEHWINSTGYPKFAYAHRFNKKKLAIELQIKQMQGEEALDLAESSSRDQVLKQMLRRGKEWFETRQADDEAVSNKFFTGSMTARVQQTDGTPYEQLFEIREGYTRIELPYTTKYRRNPRARRRKTTMNSTEGLQEGGASGLYSLGNVLQRESEMQAWSLSEPSFEEEENIAQEPYDWIRIDADFEWICQISHLHGMTDSINRWTMDRTQLQQDREVVAQLEAIDRLGTYINDPAIATVLIRTLMDTRYFFGVRVAAATALTNMRSPIQAHLGAEMLMKAFRTFYCIDGSDIPHPNDFTSRSSYLVRRGIVKALGKTDPILEVVTHFLYEQLRLNNNSSNIFSDASYVAILMETLTERLVLVSKQRGQIREADYNNGDGIQSWSAHDEFVQQCIHEIEQRGSVDTYLPSFQNILTRTSLRCRQQWEAAGLSKRQPARSWVHHLVEGSSDLLRLDALEVAIRHSMMRDPAFVSYFFETLRSSSSAWFRMQLLNLLELAVQLVAAQPTQDGDGAEAGDHGLVIEMEQDTAVKDLRKPVEKSLDAFRKSKEVQTIRLHGFWLAATSSQLSLAETDRLLRISTVLAEDDEDTKELHMTFDLPRYWGSENLGEGVLRFKRTQKVRSKCNRSKRGEEGPAQELKPLSE